MDTKDLKLKFKELMGKEITIQGWIRNHRKQKEFGFIDFYDGTSFGVVQVIYEKDLSNFDEIQKFLVGSAVTVKGIVKESNGNQDFEIKATEIILEGDSKDDYPIQPKRHTTEFLREQAYLRPRTALFNSVFKVRSVAAYAIHASGGVTVKVTGARGVSLPLPASCRTGFKVISTSSVTKRLPMRMLSSSSSVPTPPTMGML